jgi:Galactose oxidase, central domain
MAYDQATSQLVLFGGWGDSGRLGDTWTWDGTTWTLRSPGLSPSARNGASMAYDPVTSQLVLFGGWDSSGYLGDTWTWDGTTWAQPIPATSPPARYNAAMAYDQATSQFVLFGGWGGAYLADTWTFSVPVTVAPAPGPPPSTTITQAWPVTGRTTAAARAAFTGHLGTTGQHGWTRYVTTSRACGVAVSSSGRITATGRPRGRCTVSGTDSDTGTTADSGTWTYTLTIGPVTITQRGPNTAATTAAASAAFTSHFRTTGGRGPVRYVTTSRACGVIVSPAGAIRTRGRLKAGHCPVSGTDTDPARAQGKWSFTLIVTTS